MNLPVLSSKRQLISSAAFVDIFFFGAQVPAVCAFLREWWTGSGGRGVL